MFWKCIILLGKFGGDLVGGETCVAHGKDLSTSVSVWHPKTFRYLPVFTEDLSSLCPCPSLSSLLAVAPLVPTLQPGWCMGARAQQPARGLSKELVSFGWGCLSPPMSPPTIIFPSHPSASDVETPLGHPRFHVCRFSSVFLLSKPVPPYSCIMASFSLA